MTCFAPLTSLPCGAQGDRYFLKSIEPFGSGSGLFKACLIRDPDPEVAAKLAAGAINAADLSSLQDDFASPADPHRRLMYGPDTISLIKEGAPDVGAKPASTDDHNEVCTPFIPLDDVALVWSPIASEVRRTHSCLPQPRAERSRASSARGAPRAQSPLRW
jgi:hypothetical protein